MAESLADRLAAFSLATRFEDLPALVVREARRRLVDALGCASGALNEEAPRIAGKVAPQVGAGSGTATFGGGRSTPDWSAFVNGVHIRYLDCNDTYLSLEPAHPSDNWAAIMAAGEFSGSAGRDWIAAAAVAYEVQCRLCDAKSIRARGWDHVTYGALSATLAASKLMGLSHIETVHALGIAGTTGTALRLTRAGELSMWKGCAFAHSARNAVFASILASKGMTGPAPLFEGDMGFYQQVSGPFEIDRLGGPSAEDWMLPRTSIKFVPAEYHSQSAIAAAFVLRAKISDFTRIRSIEIATFKTAVEIIGKDPEKWRPKTRETADHSLPYCTVVALLAGEVSATQFSEEWLHNPIVLDLVARTTVVEDPSLTAEYPAGIPNRITVTLDDGSTLVKANSFPPGHHENPLSDEQLRIKFDSLTLGTIGKARGSELWDRVARLEEDDEPQRVIDLVRLESERELA